LAVLCAKKEIKAKPHEQQTFKHLSKYPKAIQSKREKDRQVMKRKDLESSQSSGDIIEKLLRIIKE
jgi:hypothetical protein